MKAYSKKLPLGLSALMILAAACTGLGQGETEPASLEERVADLEEALAQKSSAANDFGVRWDDGVRVESAGGDVKVRIGGRLMLDAFWGAEDEKAARAIGEFEDGADIRRARFYMSGTLYHEVDFKLEYDWGSGEADLKDTYIALRNFPLGYLRVGHYYEQYSLAALVSSKYNTFMERPPPVNAFSPVRNTGVTLDDAAFDQRMSWAVGAYLDADNTGQTTDEDLYSITGRLTGLPVYADGGERLMHVGVAGSYRNLEGELRNRARRSIRTGEFVADTRRMMVDQETGEGVPADIDAEDTVLYGLEWAVVLDAFHAQAEFTGEHANVAGGSDYQPYGWFVHAGYFLTGEHRPYSKRSGRFTRLKPKRNYGAGGWGAWEVAVRYSFLDLNDAGFEGGQLDDVVLGLNCYLNPAARFMVNYVYSDIAGAGDSHILGTRFQVAF